MEHSAGIIFIDKKHILLGHATNTKWWDLPKGHVEPGESAKDAAIRECREETGFIVEPNQLVDLGLFSYKTNKHLSLFVYILGGPLPNVEDLHCTAMHQAEDGTEFPEMDKYAWVHVDDLKHYVGSKMLRTLTNVHTLYPWLLSTIIGE